jgi:hypothetical protein
MMDTAGVAGPHSRACHLCTIPRLTAKEDNNGVDD